MTSAKKLFLLLLALPACIFAVETARAQAYPSKSIRLIVPYPPGGANDNLARPLVQKLGENMGTQVILDNRGGGGAMIGAELVAKAPADGYTLLFCSTATHATSPQLFKRVPYDPFRDFEPIVLLATSPVLAAASLPSGFTSIKDLVAAAKANPGKLTYGSGGVGSVSHLSVEIFKSMAGIDLLHVPYKGGGDFQAAPTGILQRDARAVQRPPASVARGQGCGPPARPPISRGGGLRGGVWGFGGGAGQAL